MLLTSLSRLQMRRPPASTCTATQLNSCWTAPPDRRFPPRATRGPLTDVSPHATTTSLLDEIGPVMRLPSWTTRPRGRLHVADFLGTLDITALGPLPGPDSCLLQTAPGSPSSSTLWSPREELPPCSLAALSPLAFGACPPGLPARWADDPRSRALPPPVPLLHAGFLHALVCLRSASRVMKAFLVTPLRL